MKEDISLKEDLKRKKIETPYLSELAKATPWFPQNALYFFCMSLTQLPVRTSLKFLLENLLSQSEDCWVTQTGLHSDCDHGAHQLLSKKQVLGRLQHGPLPRAFYHPSMELLWQKPALKFIGHVSSRTFPESYSFVLPRRHPSEGNKEIKKEDRNLSLSQ